MSGRGSRRKPATGADEDWPIRLGFYIHDTSRLRKLVFDAAFKPAGASRAQAAVLSYLQNEDGLTQSDLARRLDLGKVALGSLVDKLEAGGMVERRADDTDRRAKRIALTAKGRRALKDLRTIGEQANEAVLEGLSARDIETTARTLRRMKANLLAILNGDGENTDD